MATIEERVSRLEGMMERIESELSDLRTTMDSRFSNLENRLNTQIQLTIAMWVTTMAAVLAVLVTVLLKS